MKNVHIVNIISEVLCNKNRALSFDKTSTSCYMDREAQGSRAIKARACEGLYSSRALRLPVHITNSGIYCVYYEKRRDLTSL